MKFKSINKYIRRDDWFTAVAPSHKSIKAAHKWCTDINNPSYRFFYHHYTNTRWWFESEQDAIMFALTWGGR